MKESKHRILVIDDEPKHLQLMKEFLPKLHNVEVDVASHPEDAMKLIELRKDPYPVIWSDYNFENSKTNGIVFLKVVSKVSPLSSRLLCSANFHESELTSMVEDGAIQTYISKPINAEPTTSAIKIAIEYHKVNLFEEFLDLEIQNFISENHLEEISQKLDTLYEFFGHLEKVNFVDRRVELNKLLAHIQVVLEKIPTMVTRQEYLNCKLKEGEGNERELKLLKNCLNKIKLLEDYLIQSNQKIIQNLSKFTNGENE